MKIANLKVSIENVDKAELKIFAEETPGQETEITDLYWFEENFIHDFNTVGIHGNVNIRIELVIPVRAIL